MAIQTCPVGIHRMSPDIPGLVQTSNNLARVSVANGQVDIQCLNRSSVDSEKDDHARSIEAAFALAGLQTERSGQYPGWTPNPSSEASPCAKACTRSVTTKAPRVLACHAGLECGILWNQLPGDGHGVVWPQHPRGAQPRRMRSGQLRAEVLGVFLGGFEPNPSCLTHEPMDPHAL